MIITTKNFLKDKNVRIQKLLEKTMALKVIKHE